MPRWDPLRQIRIRGIDQAHIGFEFGYPIQQLIHRAKYHGDLTTMLALTDLLTNSVPLVDQTSVLYPVPLGFWRRMGRGFNQAAVLAQAISLSKGMLIDEVSVHKRLFSGHQAALDAKRRWHNARDLFVLRRPTITDDAVIVDDVVTTGATAAAYARALRAGGARRVTLIALAAVR